ncbi:MAG: hypothetical protein B6U97_03595 [Candidatus Altiarchaeales archaeon ex4484_96]|nr:MAG: hypothetical protein B6U97_03595 [Candidatus Altiarchaeales archaeon ex4484_96]
MIQPTQREILEVLVEIYEKDKKLVRGEEIAKQLNKSSGTIRNQMQTLRALNYVEGVPGPRGGYIPEMKAYEALGLASIENPIVVPIYREEEKLDGIYAQKITFKNITDPKSCSVIISLLGDTRKIDDGDEILIGPTPVNHVIVCGKVIGRDDTKRELLLNARSITSIPQGKVSSISTKKLISLTPSMSLQECSKRLVGNHINGAPIIEDDKLVGILTESEIVKAVSEGKKTAKAKDLGIRDVYTIDEDSEIISCINRMQKYDVGRLIVTKDNHPVGIITRTDILLRMIQ